MSEPSGNEPLATFQDPHTLCYARMYPFEVARLWRAVTDSEELNIWLYPVTRVEPERGGRCIFTWGAPEAPEFEGTVARFEPGTQIRYALGEDNWVQFDLEDTGDGTRLVFTQYFGPGYRHADDGQIEDRAGAQPAGPGTPWRAGILAGFHINFDLLRRFLIEDWSRERIREESRRCVEGTNGGTYTAALDEPDSTWDRLVDLYYDHIVQTCPRPGSRTS